MVEVREMVAFLQVIFLASLRTASRDSSVRRRGWSPRADRLSPCLERSRETYYENLNLSINSRTICHYIRRLYKLITDVNTEPFINLIMRFLVTLEMGGVLIIYFLF